MNAADSVERAIKGDDFRNPGGLGLRDEVGLGEVQALKLIDLQCAMQQRPVNGLDACERERRAHHQRDAAAVDLI